MVATVIGTKRPETVVARPARVTVTGTLGGTNSMTAAVVWAKRLGTIFTCPTLFTNARERVGVALTFVRAQTGAAFIARRAGPAIQA